MSSEQQRRQSLPHLQEQVGKYTQGLEKISRLTSPTAQFRDHLDYTQTQGAERTNRIRRQGKIKRALIAARPIVEKRLEEATLQAQETQQRVDALQSDISVFQQDIADGLFPPDILTEPQEELNRLLGISDQKEEQEVEDSTGKITTRLQSPIHTVGETRSEASDTRFQAAPPRRDTAMRDLESIVEKPNTASSQTENNREGEASPVWFARIGGRVSSLDLGEYELLSRLLSASTNEGHDQFLLTTRLGRGLRRLAMYRDVPNPVPTVLSQIRTKFRIPDSNPLTFPEGTGKGTKHALARHDIEILIPKNDEDETPPPLPAKPDPAPSGPGTSSPIEHAGQRKENLEENFLRLSDEETGHLCGVLNRENGTTITVSRLRKQFTFALDDEMQAACKELLGNYTITPPRGTSLTDFLQEERLKIIQKISPFLEEDDDEKVVAFAEAQAPQTEKQILWLYLINQEWPKGLLKEFLEDSVKRPLSRNTLQKTWTTHKRYEERPQPIPQPEEAPPLIIGPHTELKGDEIVLGVFPALQQEASELRESVVTPIPPATMELIEGRHFDVRASKKPEAEQRDPSLRTQLEINLDKIEAAGIAGPIGMPELTFHFPRIKGNFIKRAIEGGFISPVRGAHGWHKFNPTEIAILYYLREKPREVVIEPKHAKDLAKIAEEVRTQREADKKADDIILSVK